MDKKMWNVVNNPLLVSLAEKAGMQPYYDDQEKQMAQFMEVVVRECAQFVDPVTKIHMFKHFGLDEDRSELLRPWIVLYKDSDQIGAPVWAWQCQAEDMEHAEEQFMNAFPEVEYHNILWVDQSSDVEVVLDKYYSSSQD